jgi:hypothetical protein
MKDNRDPEQIGKRLLNLKKKSPQVPLHKLADLALSHPNFYTGHVDRNNSNSATVL